MHERKGGHDFNVVRRASPLTNLRKKDEALKRLEVDTDLTPYNPQSSSSSSSTPLTPASG